jgi:superfamily II DNA or RNA helicase
MFPNLETLDHQKPERWDQGETEKVVLWSLECLKLMPHHPKAALHFKNGLFDGLNAFHELENRLSKIGIEKEKGDAFEVFAEAYLATQRRHEASDVWPLGTAPLPLLEKAGITSNDLGIDGLYVTPVGELNAYQVKYRANRPALTWRELSTFIGLADSPNIRNRVLITNCEEFPDLLNQRTNFFCIKGADFDRLDAEAFQEIAEWIKGSSFHKKRKEPREHQKEAIGKILGEFAIAERTTAVMACGTGKTLVGLWVMEALNPVKAVIFMPSLALIRQTLHEWLRETKIEQFSFLCVCSDQSVSEGIDSLVIHQADLDFEVTTDPKRVRAYLDSPFSGTKVVFTTYHSAPVIGEALTNGEKFDYGVFDEAHKTAGKKDKRSGFALDDHNITIQKRLFLTATPKRYNPLKRDDEGEAETILSMDDKTIYGNHCFVLSFGRAVDSGIICPYEVLISVITTDRVTNEMLRHGEVAIEGDNVTALQVAHQIAVRDAVSRYDVKKIFTFHSSVKAASIFTEKGARGIKAHIKECETFHVNGAMPSNHREKIMKSFCAAPLAIMSNARCLTEGVDVPAVDMVAFLAPRKSQIEIIQAAGRAMRKADGKKKGYILVPLLVEQKKGESVESAVRRADYIELWDVLQNLKEHDDVLSDIIAEYGQAIKIPSSSAARDMVDRRIHIIAPEIPLKDIEQAIIAKSFEQLTSVWDTFYNELKLYYHDSMHCNIEYYLDENAWNRSIFKWLRRQRALYKEGRLKREKVEKLNRLGIIWNYKRNERNDDWHEWEQEFLQLTRYKKRYGTPYPQSGAIVKWLKINLSLMDSGALEGHKDSLLRCIGISPDERYERQVNLNRDTEWNVYYQKLKDHLKNNDAGISLDVMPPDLGRWIAEQQRGKNKLTSGQIMLLNEILFPWKKPTRESQEPILKTWDESYFELKMWWRTRNNYFFSQMKPEVSRWAKEQCIRKRQGALSEEQIKLLDQISFPWNRF